MFKNREAISPEKVDSIVGELTELDGKIVGDGSMRVDGRINGEVEVKGDLIVGEKGKVTAEVSAKNMSIAGYVHGNIVVSGRLEILPTGRFEGNAKVGTLVVEEGAGFKGQCEMTLSDPTQGKRVTRLFGDSDREAAVEK